MKLQNHETQEQVIAKGIIYGLLFDGTSGSYPSINFYGETLEKVELKANKALEDGSIDSGMGFESIKMALLYVTTTTSIKVEGYTFTHEEETTLMIGNITEDVIAFLSGIHE